jgi:hypothetical protein
VFVRREMAMMNTNTALALLAVVMPGVLTRPAPLTGADYVLIFERRSRYEEQKPPGDSRLEVWCIFQVRPRLSQLAAPLSGADNGP